MLLLQEGKNQNLTHVLSKTLALSLFKLYDILTSCKNSENFSEQFQRADQEITIEIFKFILSSSDKTKPTFSVPLVCLNHRSTETKLSTHSYYLQNEHNLTLVHPGFQPVIQLSIVEGQSISIQYLTLNICSNVMEPGTNIYQYVLHYLKSILGYHVI